ncbi:MAG: tRNA (adenosine(37)-N6)-dimethylallyltransferase MiaA [Muribaculum sp.]|nr:tRNA (adenosine(37)-N6)-dimethylallyltransferase MiaA [Muribaculaceae bacterium]MCM1081078.1 tRNA (adenosine(37)-N6)-dimethylallyltransferase MiaA [Muribaculum sp.]
MHDTPLLIVVTGATASGKTDLAIELAENYGCDIISADSRQIFKGIPIGTAAPTQEQLARVNHHFVAQLELDQYYSAACFERDVLKLLPDLFQKSDVQIMCGGSMMYVDAIVNGIDDLPTITPQVREYVANVFQNDGLAGLRMLLKNLDPDYLDKVDIANPRRLIHAIEVSIQSGKPYSSLCTGKKKERPFRIVQFAIAHERETLFSRINHRTQMMINAGLVDEAKSVFHLRHLNSLNTVGYKEMFAYFDGTFTLSQATDRMAKNSRVYAKKQLTWIKRNDNIIWLSPDNPYNEALKALQFYEMP